MNRKNSHRIQTYFVIIILSISFFVVIHTKRIHSCIDLDNQNNILVELPQLRQLQTITNPHGFRIKFLDPPTTPGVDPTQMTNMFGISALFFKQLLKVTDVSDSTKYTPSYNCGTITKNSIYASQGFSFTSEDMVISTQLENAANTNYVAYAAPCLLRTWPQYGLIGFNIAFFSADPTKTAQFQSNLLTLIHEITHILAFHPFLFGGRYRKAYLSSQPVLSCETTAIQNGRTFIITPNVRSWAQKHFGCNQQLLGGLVQQQGLSGSAGTHWERATTLDDYMTASVYFGNKITQITLHLFKDTGYFYDVDFSLAENNYFGKNKGCTFARGLGDSNQFNPQYCTSNTTLTIFPKPLDFYNFFGGSCIKAAFSSNAKLVQVQRQFACFDSQFSSYSLSTVNTFGYSSRAFQAISTDYTGPHCFQAQCSNNNNDVLITIGGATGTCTIEGSKSISISGTTIYCPQYIDIFCSRQNCVNHCAGQGYCSQGSCLSSTLCTSIDTNCIRCKDGTCTGCSSNLFPSGSSPVCDTCENILPSCTNGCQTTQAGVTVCKQSNQLSLDFICIQSTTNDENSNLGLILGLIIPISVCFLVILITFICVGLYLIIKHKAKTKTLDTYDASQQKKQTNEIQVNSNAEDEGNSNSINKLNQ